MTTEEERDCNSRLDTVRLHQCQAGHVVISTCRFVFDQGQWGKAQCETTADKPAFLQTSIITNPPSLLFSTLFFLLIFDSYWFLLFLRFSLIIYLNLLYTSVCVCPQVISGSNLPLPSSGKALDPFVRVEIHGIASDTCRKNTHTVKNNCRWQNTNCAYHNVPRHSNLFSIMLDLASLWSVQVVFCQN